MKHSLFKKTLFVLFFSALGVGLGTMFISKPPQEAPPLGIGLSDLEEGLLKNQNLSAQELQDFIQKHAYKYDTVSGHYLAGRFAQRHHDWKTASQKLWAILKKTQNPDPVFLKRVMVLSMGAGEYSLAISMAKKIQGQEQDPEQDKDKSQDKGKKGSSALAALFLAMDDFKNQDYKTAISHVRAMPRSGLSNFIMPLLYGWANAALGTYDISDLKAKAARAPHMDYFNHMILISDFMKHPDQIEAQLKRMSQSQNLSEASLDFITDIYMHIGQPEQAIALYEKNKPPQYQAKIKAIQDGRTQSSFTSVQTPEEGVAKAFYDMALLLAQDYNDESARVFCHMAIYLDPIMSDARFLLARLASRNDHDEEAITLYTSILPTENNAQDYIMSRQFAAELLEEQEKPEEAITLLEGLYKDHKDIESLIQMGDIYRRSENYSKAITLYNKAEKALGGPIPSEYWYLHYMRGMAYEQMEDWSKAEKDLQAALDFQPDNPLVLNYLGYAWADQGQHLDKALALIEKAARLRPVDGYITDSLGWILYRMNRFSAAIPHLEQAIELKPYDPVINDHLGDAYWRVGRKLEARFQWTRAKNHSEEEQLKEDLARKLIEGLPDLAIAPIPTQPDIPDIKETRVLNHAAGKGI